MAWKIMEEGDRVLPLIGRPTMATTGPEPLAATKTTPLENTLANLEATTPGKIDDLLH